LYANPKPHRPPGTVGFLHKNQFKLAGFKSFVDPTHVALPGQLVGVVGPNGCGKSNVIDAVRWVLGESSAKHLRGETMQDVIFNGSGGRRPVGTASVELIFDNSDGKIGGTYATVQRDLAQARRCRATARRHTTSTASACRRTRRQRRCSWAPAWATQPTPSSSRA
jgi:chromosome segregation protein